MPVKSAAVAPAPRLIEADAVPPAPALITRGAPLLAKEAVDKADRATLPPVAVRSRFTGCDALGVSVKLVWPRPSVVVSRVSVVTALALPIRLKLAPPVPVNEWNATPKAPVLTRLFRLV